VPVHPPLQNPPPKPPQKGHLPPHLPKKKTHVKVIERHVKWTDFMEPWMIHGGGDSSLPPFFRLFTGHYKWRGGASLFLAAWFLAFSALNLFRIVGKCILCFAFALPLCFYSSSLNLGVHQTKASFIRMHDNEMNEWIKWWNHANNDEFITSFLMDFALLSVCFLLHPSI